MQEINALKAAARRLCDGVAGLSFAAPVEFVYNPLVYAWDAYIAYLERYGGSRKKVIFLGMNPGPWGMAQTGIPFGEVAAVRDFLNIQVAVGKPEREHPKRPVEGFACRRSEVSGKRMWGLFQQRFATPAAFFENHFVANYCPLVFMEQSAGNRTPDRLKAEEAVALFELCDHHLQEMVAILQVEWVVGVGRFPEKCALRALKGQAVKIAQILHPSPASPAANNDWSGTVTRQLIDCGIWQ